MSTTDLVPIARCVQCGEVLEPGARFCSNCGQAVEDESAAQKPTYWSENSTNSEWRAPAPATMPPLSAAFDSGGGIGKLFSGSGRIGRLEYFLTVVAVWVVLIIAWSIIVVADVPALTIVVGVATWLLAVVVSVCAGVKRLHDFDQSGWLYLLFLIPFASFIMLLVLLLKGGSIGLNRYGYEDSGSVMR